MEMKKENIKLGLLFAIGAGMWMMSAPTGLTVQSWHLTIIFICTMLGIVMNPLPISAIALLGSACALLTHTLTTDQVLKGFGDKVVWLLVFAFLIARGMIKTGLGSRIACYFISKVGRTTIGSAYGLVLTEFMLSPVIPSNTARSGGIVFPIANSIAEGYAAHAKSASQSTTGYLMQVCFQANVITSAMFLTSMSANPLIQSFLDREGIPVTWNSWALGSIVPGIISLILMPLIVYFLHPPSVKSAESAQEQAKVALKAKGGLTMQEIMMVLTFVFLIGFWIFGSYIKIDATSTALIGVVILLLTRVLDWSDVVNEKGAWDTMVWFAVVVMLSGYLAEFGVIKWFSGKIAHELSQYNANIAVPILFALYFYIHYMFASMTAHITVLFTTFLLLITGFGMPPLLTGMMLTYGSSLCGGLTHYSSAVAPIFYASKSVTTKEWWTIGFAMSVVNIIIWLTVGGAWWKYLGWF